MDIKEFCKKLIHSYVFLNILAMMAVVVALFVAVKYGLNSYTQHGHSIAVPDLRSMTFAQAKILLEQNNLSIAVSDSGHNKKMPAECILAQNPKEGSHVKSGRIIYVTINSTASPSFTIPDIIDNCSSREAIAKLTAIGYKLLEPELVEGEKDWVYGIVCRGKKVSTGDLISIDLPLRLQIGKGYDDGVGSADNFSDSDYLMDSGETTDDFVEIE